jgi:hypothetical protein
MVEMPNLDRGLVTFAEWDLWYQDTLDPECPRQVELTGRGLVQGLMALWVRHLFETVQSDGELGFSRFNLWWRQASRSIEITDDKVGAKQLRQWVYGTQQHANRNYVKVGDEELLQLVALTHCKLVLSAQTSEIILNAAKESKSHLDFVSKLMKLAENE